MNLGGWIVANEGALRFAVFSMTFTALAIFEAWRPALPRILERVARWKANLGLGLVSSLSLRVLLPGAAVLAAVFAQMRGWGLFNALDWPVWLEIALAVLLLDFAIYLQHVITHRVPVLWRLHQVHHADHEVDVTTALRFHPIEIVLSQLYKAALVVALGVDPFAVVVFEIMLNASAMFNHANLKLSPRVDRALRAVLVTPDMHRIHHSQRPDETDSNFGFGLSLWDRLCRTYREAPVAPLAIGLEAYRGAPASNLVWTLLLPFRKSA